MTRTNDPSEIGYAGKQGNEFYLLIGVVVNPPGVDSDGQVTLARVEPALIDRDFAAADEAIAKGKATRCSLTACDCPRPICKVKWRWRAGTLLPHDRFSKPLYQRSKRESNPARATDCAALVSFSSLI